MHNPSWRHHYIPAFYLSRWAGVNGKVKTYERPHDEVVVRGRHPNAIGFEGHLYPGGLEERFFKPLDNNAAVALRKIEQGSLRRADMTDRSDWSLFLMSLMMRTPEDLRVLRERWPSYFFETDAKAEDWYQRDRIEGDPSTFKEYLEALPPALVEEAGYNIWLKLINHPIVGKTINGLDWRIINFDRSNTTLLTSDRPLIVYPPIQGPKGHVALPISPRRLFVASADREFLDAMQRAPQSGLAKEANRQVVGPAVRFVWGADETHRRFVEKRMGTLDDVRSLQRVFQMRLAARSS